MAAVKKIKKPAAKSKLKAGKKNKVNKWLILGGVAAVAIVGAVIVRFSSASQWVSITRNANPATLRSGVTVSTSEVTITKGHTYRVCANGYSLESNNNVSAKIYFVIRDLNGRNPRERYISAKTYGKDRTLRCSKSFYATQSYRASGVVWNVDKPGQYNRGAELHVNAISIDYLR